VATISPGAPEAKALVFTNFTVTHAPYSTRNLEILS
jgi:hypothetical protein